MRSSKVPIAQSNFCYISAWGGRKTNECFVRVLQQNIRYDTLIELESETKKENHVLVVKVDDEKIDRY